MVCCFVLMLTLGCVASGVVLSIEDTDNRVARREKIRGEDVVRIL